MARHTTWLFLQLTSYGGYLDYIINYSVDSNATPIRHVADVFLVGEQATLVHYSAAPTHPNRNIRHAVALKEVNLLLAFAENKTLISKNLKQSYLNLRSFYIF